MPTALPEQTPMTATTAATASGRTDHHGYLDDDNHHQLP